MSFVVRRGTETLTKAGTLAPVPLAARADYAIEYGSVDVGGAKRRVIITRPRHAGKHPAVLLIGGIGCYSLDGILRPPELHDAYATLLASLTRAGYATMRVEKSGMGDSEGPPCATRGPTSMPRCARSALHPGRATFVQIEGMEHGLYLAGTAEASMNATEPFPVATLFVEETLRFFSGTTKAAASH